MYLSNEYIYSLNCTQIASEQIEYFSDDDALHRVPPFTHDRYIDARYVDAFHVLCVKHLSISLALSRRNYYLHFSRANVSYFCRDGDTLYIEDERDTRLAE